MRIIDTHVHLGTSRFSGVRTTEEELIGAMDRNGVTASLVMPQPALENIDDVHNQIARFSKEYPGRIFGMASLDSWLPEQDYLDRIALCMEQDHFAAIKLHPLGHNISPLAPQCNKIYEAAARYDVPVLVHTGIGNPFSLPSLVMDAAKRFPGVTFILAHAGGSVSTLQAGGCDADGGDRAA